MRPAKFRNSEAGQSSEERHAFGDDADLTLHFDWMLLHIKSENFNSSRAGR